MMKGTRGISFTRIAAMLFLLLISGCTDVEREKPAEEEDLKLTLKRQDCESAAYTFDRRFSFGNSLSRIDQIREALESFQRLTEEGKGRLSDEALGLIGNTDWETQHLGFANWVRAVEGTVRKQDYQIKKLEYELAKGQFESGEMSEEGLKQKRSDFRGSVQAFQAFWDSFHVVD